MFQQEYIQKGRSLAFCGYVIKPGDIKSCLLTLTDLSGMINSFSIRVVRGERPRKKLIIDVELANGFLPLIVSTEMYLLEWLARMKALSIHYVEFIKTVPLEAFPELHFHPYGLLNFEKHIYYIKKRYLI